LPAGRLSRRPTDPPREFPPVAHTNFLVLRHQRHLPHWDAIGQPQFITFRLLGSLPATRVFRREHVATSGEAFVTMDRLLDKGATGPLHLRRPEIADLVVRALIDSDLRFQRCRPADSLGRLGGIRNPIKMSDATPEILYRP
jgi:hypothetical protein